jgi:hypothetical protein
VNCKEGDIAISVGSRNGGRLFKVLYLAPVGCSFDLPNGVRHRFVGGNVWVVRVLDGTIMAKATDGSISPVNYGCADDKHLRPLRPDEEEALDECCESTSSAEQS